MHILKSYTNFTFKIYFIIIIDGWKINCYHASILSTNDKLQIFKNNYFLNKCIKNNLKI